MSVFASVAFIAVAVAASAQATDIVAGCRTAHQADPAAHIACLEAALLTPGTAASAKNAPVGLGAEQVRASQRSPDTPAAQTTVQIISASYNGQGYGVFRMADGQVWRETDKTPERQRLAPGKRYEARIESGKLGGYRMYVEGVRRMLKVERVE